MIPLSELAAKYTPWSLSKAELAATCPRRFNHAYVLKTKKKAPTSALLVGQVIHKMLEMCLKGCSIQQALSFAEKDNSALMSDDLEKINALLPYVSSFLQKATTYIDKYSPIHKLIETKLAISQTGSTIGYYDKSCLLRGVVDLALLLKQQHAIIIDHKTGKPKDLSQYESQFGCYRLLLKASYPQLTGMQSAVNFIQEDRVEFDIFRETSIIDPLMDTVITFLNESSKDLADLEKTSTGWWCGWCDYDAGCPAKAA